VIKVAELPGPGVGDHCDRKRIDASVANESGKHVELALLGRAAAMFVVTNIDDMLVLAVFFGRARGNPSSAVRVIIGQYLGFVAILAVSVLGALGASLLPEAAIPYLGLLPLLLGIRAAWDAWRSRVDPDADDESPTTGGAGAWEVAVVTFANGGDNIGVYVPVFAVSGIGSMIGYVTVFLVGVAIWCAVGWYIATRPAVTKVLSRWGHILFPVILIGIGVVILVQGGAFGL
jgi:cadmium resistance protein CadD (predicted permease)